MHRAILLAVAAACGCESSSPLTTQLPYGPTYACGAAPGVCTGADCVLNVRDYGAQGNGKTDDTQAIQCAIDAASNAALFPSGAAVYLPAGRYPISIAKSSCGGASALAIGASNVRLFGDGDSSILYVPTWEETSGPTLDLITSYLFVGSSLHDVNNVVLERFAFVGQLHVDSPLSSSRADAVQFGTATQTHTVNFSGMRDMLFQGTARALGMYGGPSPGQGIIPAIQGTGNFVIDSRFTDLGGQVVGCHSAEYVDMLVRGNIMHSVEGLAIESFSGRMLIEGNVIDDARGGAVAFNQDPSSLGWSIVSQNSITTIGKGTNPPPHAIQLGEVTPAYRVKIIGNTIQNAYGSGIMTYQACGLDVEDNVIDGYGLGALGMTGISAYNIGCGAQVTANRVRCTSSDAGCHWGIITGGSEGVDSWADSNSVAGVTNAGGLALLMNESTGTNGAGTNVFTGRNVDLDTGQDAPFRDFTDTPSLPTYRVNGGSYSVAGAKVWQFSNGTGAPTTVSGLTGCSLGETVTLLFDGPDSTTLTDDGPAGPFDLNGNFTAAGGHNSVLSLLCVSLAPPVWVEVSRSND